MITRAVAAFVLLVDVVVVVVVGGGGVASEMLLLIKAPGLFVSCEVREWVVAEVILTCLSYIYVFCCLFCQRFQMLD